MPLTLPYPSLGTGVVDPTAIEANFNEIAGKFGNMTTADLSASAGVTVGQLANSYEWMVIPLSVSTLAATGIGTSTFVPMYNDTKGAWTVAAITYMTSDVGTKTATFRVEYGYWNATVWTPGSDVSATTTVTATTNNDGIQGSAATTGLTSIVLSTSPVKALTVAVIANDAAATAPLYVSVLLKRQITAA